MLELFYRSKTEYIYIEYTLNKHIIVVVWFLLTLSTICYAFKPITMERLIVHLHNDTTIILNGMSCYCPKTIYVNFYLFLFFLLNFPCSRVLSESNCATIVSYNYSNTIAPQNRLNQVITRKIYIDSNFRCWNITQMFVYCVVIKYKVWKIINRISVSHSKGSNSFFHTM